VSLEPILEAKASDASRVTTILRVGSSARQATSFGRDVTDRVIDRILELYPGGRVIGRDLAEAPPPPVDNAWVDANNTP
jgi:FMN-dependent NADH-azoreductase